ncbi:hypothetical protein CH275_13900 [Rhodococcus sp. 06-235-1A]|uniref:DUF429 domain-containing protein n=1 Tax=Rhodococcus sp. 06-235-1A TaxID=2022508 RepID=UPI000B9A7CD3|nr:DUF429 domain-containing protein [Rhodococcus sp. 06-235-1A]OZD04330.1 hypothetical protein CH275_13900 [Rhodococcus sp. 06-235-1A]
MNSEAEKFAGVDGAKGAWVVASFDGTTLTWRGCSSVADVLEHTTDCARVGVDMPLSLPASGYRISELEAKKFLGPARSSIFHTPVLDVLAAESYPDACAVSRRITGKAISKQTWHILPSVEAWRSASFDPDKYVEVHPECSFRAMSPTTSFASKKTGRGVGQRMAALERWSEHIDLADLPLGPAVDDFLDAAAAAWSARRFHLGEHRVFGTADRSDRIVA